MKLTAGRSISFCRKGCLVTAILVVVFVFFSDAMTAYNVGDFGYAGRNKWGTAPTVFTSVSGDSLTDSVTMVSSAGLAVGYTVAIGNGIVPGAYITGINGNIIHLSQLNSGTVSGSIYFTAPQIANVAVAIVAGLNTITMTSKNGLQVGMYLAAGSGITPGTTVTAINGNVLTLSDTTTGNFPIGTPITFTVPYNWRQWDGAAWVTPFGPTNFFPTANDNVYILSGDSVTVEVSGKDCKSLFVEATSQLCADPTQNSNFYMNVYGKEITNNGIIGSATAGLFNGISFNIEGDTCAILTDSISPVLPANIPVFTCSRIRKSSVSAPASMITNLFIGMNIYGSFFSNSQTQVYNNAANSVFNITINQNSTLNIGYLGNIAINGIAGMSGGNRAGTITVKGNLYVAGTTYLSSANTSATANTICQLIIDSTGLVNTQIINTQSSNSTGGVGVPKHKTIIRAVGKLEITGTTWNQGLNFFAEGATYNSYDFQYNSTVAYIGNGAQLIAIDKPYSNLLLTSLPVVNKTLNPGNLTVNKNFTIQNNAVFVPSTRTINIGGNLNIRDRNSITPGTSLFFFNGFDSTQQTITSGDSAKFYSLKDSNALGVKMFSNVAVANNLDLRGSLDLNAKTLSINNALGGAITRTTGNIISEDTLNLGKVKWAMGSTGGAHIFPFGTVAGAYIPVKFTRTSGTPDTVTISTYPTAADNTPWPTQPVAVTNMLSSTGLLPDNRSATMKRFWQVDISGSGFANLSLTFNPTEVPDSAGPYNIQRWYGSAWPIWVIPYATQTTSGDTVTAVGINAFGALAMTSVTSPLPINLLHFTAEPKGGAVIAKWTTLSEEDNDFFTVERMNANGEIEQLGRVSGAGNSNVPSDYFFVDRNPLPGRSYYRITQTDYDGKSESFKWVAVNFTKGGRGLLLYPNPSGGEVVYLLSTAENEEDLTYKILDINGREVQTGHLNSSASISVKELSRGVYFFIFSSLKKEPFGLRFIRE